MSTQATLMSHQGKWGIANKLFKGEVVSHEQGTETMPWLRQAMASQMPRRDACMGAQAYLTFLVIAIKHRVVSLLRWAWGRCPTPVHVDLVVGLMT